MPSLAIGGQRLLNEAEVFVVAAVCERIPDKLGVASTVLCVFAEQALKRYGSAHSKPTMCRPLHGGDEHPMKLVKATLGDVAITARQKLKNSKSCCLA